ncbi:hydrophobic protein [Streptomyces hesseae]|uniref:Hydrophobic protein n=1 Tax=Streptomyces hesseae TaxID=3075519 RepID=A0ABU2SFQ5_9ACTN|nr:hydrophobic protein [Streptomyces sp. DSM 40473]MDT0447712.1 hydrophobic protein [Streptomyces sp. DSM 40473]
MIISIVLLLLALVLFGFGFAMHLLWIAAAVVLIVWILGFARHRRGRQGGGRRYAGNRR